MNKRIKKLDKDELRFFWICIENDSRMLTGQLINFCSEFIHKKEVSYNLLNHLEKKIKFNYFPELSENSSYGIFSREIKYRANVGYEMYKQIAYVICKGMNNVHSSPSLKTTNIPFIKIYETGKNKKRRKKLA
jgi:hypothetical protein